MWSSGGVWVLSIQQDKPLEILFFLKDTFSEVKAGVQGEVETRASPSVCISSAVCQYWDQRESEICIYVYST